jgi:hypothetical protein
MHAERWEANPTSDLPRTTLRLLALGALIVCSLWIVRPFLVATAWATMIAVATWPLLLRVERSLGGRRSVAVAVMTTVLLLTLLVPFYLGVTPAGSSSGRSPSRRSRRRRRRSGWPSCRWSGRGSRRAGSKSWRPRPRSCPCISHPS